MVKLPALDCETWVEILVLYFFVIIIRIVRVLHSILVSYGYSDIFDICKLNSKTCRVSNQILTWHCYFARINHIFKSHIFDSRKEIPFSLLELRYRVWFKKYKFTARFLLHICDNSKILKF